MARRMRPDWEGALHHVMARGIDGRAVFGDESDKSDLYRRFAKLIPDLGLSVYAWVIMPNHFHLLASTGPNPLSFFMHRLLTGYSVSYNLRNDRKGHVFQGRFRSILVQENAYFRRVIRYIHRNPIKAGIVEDINELEQYRWCGHGAITGKQSVPWQDSDHVISSFTSSFGSGQTHYISYVSSNDHTADEELTSGTFILGKDGISHSWTNASHDGWSNCCRVLGDRAFALDAYSRLRNIESWTLRDRGEVHDFIESAFEWIEENWKIPRDAIQGNSRSPMLSDARAALAWFFHEHLGLSQTEIANLLKMTRSGVRNALNRTLESHLEHLFI